MLEAAALRREGRDLTILTYGAMLYQSLEAAETLARDDGVETEVVDLRSLLPLDKDAILASARKTGKVLVVWVEHNGAANPIYRVQGQLLSCIEN